MNTHTHTQPRTYTHTHLCFGFSHRPVPRISWQKDNVTISSPEQSGRVLIIRDVQSSDAGVYICISVQDGFDNITATATVSVIGMSMMMI